MLIRPFLFLLLLCSCNAAPAFLEGYYGAVPDGTSGRDYEFRDGRFTSVAWSCTYANDPIYPGSYETNGTSVRLKYDNPKLSEEVFHWRTSAGVHALVSKDALIFFEAHGVLLEHAPLPTRAEYFVLLGASRPSNRFQESPALWRTLLHRQPDFVRFLARNSFEKLQWQKVIPQ